MTSRTVFLQLLLGVSSIAIVAQSKPVSPVSIDTAVYAALLDSIGLRPLPDTLLLGDSTLTFRAPTGGIPTWRTQFDSIPSELPPKLEVASQTKLPSSALALPRPVRIVARVELDEIFASGPDGWREFYRRYPRQRSWILFSPIAFSVDSVHALVYYEYHCGGLCGGGDAVWLMRNAKTGRWFVRKRVMFWVS